ncbi:MAG: hypothetical protein JRI65_04515 [Deltaproteobacteria bacterium]|nr:hypothetical protein [Deltaproteobacteria bacterium]
MMEKQKGLLDEAAMAMERISRELRDANSISSPTSGSTSSTLTFTKSHGSPEETSTYDITFQLSSGTLQRKGDTTVNLAEAVSAFTVKRVTSGDKEEITMTLTLEEGTGGNITLQSYICPKNLPYPDPEAPSGRNFGGCWEEDFQ